MPLLPTPVLISVTEANVSVGRQTSWHPGHTLSGSDPMLHHHSNETERLSVEQDATGAVTPTVSNHTSIQGVDFTRYWGCFRAYI